MPATTTYDTIIIGAGMSGLAAGIRLAYFDQRVCILERHYTIGGLNSFYRLRGRDYDVGLHAVTNFTPKGAKKGPLARLLRQLRFRWEDFSLSPQVGSTIVFPGTKLRFGNGLDLLTSEVERAFPAEVDNFQRLLDKIIDYDDLDQESFDISTRDVLQETISDPLLIEMLLCPMMWYGNAQENDMAFGAFSIMFNSIFCEGFARPLAGVRLILKNLVRRYRELGGELKLRSGVKRIHIEAGSARGVVLDDDTELAAGRILSSAGWVETMRMCDDVRRAADARAGQLTFTEAIGVLDCKPESLGHRDTVVFFNDSETFHWEKSSDLCDVRTGVICSPNNYLYDSTEVDIDKCLPDGVMRVTAIANYDKWANLSADQYEAEKMRWFDRTTAAAVRFVPDYRGHIIDSDFFTPTTIKRFTWHDNGAVYGALDKKLDGTTDINNLYICGTDQGYVGIVGAIFSGIAVANRHLLRA